MFHFLATLPSSSMAPPRAVKTSTQPKARARTLATRSYLGKRTTTTTEYCSPVPLHPHLLACIVEWSACVSPPRARVSLLQNLALVSKACHVAAQHRLLSSVKVYSAIEERSLAVFATFLDLHSDVALMIHEVHFACAISIYSPGSHVVLVDDLRVVLPKLEHLR